MLGDVSTSQKEKSRKGQMSCWSFREEVGPAVAERHGEEARFTSLVFINKLSGRNVESILMCR